MYHASIMYECNCVSPRSIVDHHLPTCHEWLTITKWWFREKPTLLPSWPSNHAASWGLIFYYGLSGCDLHLKALWKLVSERNHSQIIREGKRKRPHGGTYWLARFYREEMNRQWNIFNVAFDVKIDTAATTVCGCKTTRHDFPFFVFFVFSFRVRFAYFKAIQSAW